ncbi:hypothetical protein RhiirA5_417352 [Rhizophagus irregularis]|uniref:Uncharacterized protein n=1 Tax=Rhizophagus irregularis TaxID=588596 RepID=A0A2N0PMT6_9GLOM|nr:hypothetical protein RhiirA5_417352 [Rhizophagus irregularis]
MKNMKNYKSYSYRRDSSPPSRSSRDRIQISRSGRDSSPPFRLSKDRTRSGRDSLSPSRSSRDRSQISRSGRDSSSPSRSSRGRSQISRGRSQVSRSRSQTLRSSRDRSKEKRGDNYEGRRHEGRDNRYRSREEGRDYEAEIMELRLTVSELSKEIKEVREVQAHNQDQTAIEHRLKIRSSLSPKPLEYTKRFWKNMKPMDHRYKKSFRDEVVQILKGLDSSLSIDLFDYKKKWTEIEKDVLREIIPVIKKAMDNRFQYTDTELKKVLQNYHRHQRDAYTISTKPLKLKANKQRVGTNSRRKDKKERR